MKKLNIYKVKRQSKEKEHAKANERKQLEESYCHRRMEGLRVVWLQIPKGFTINGPTHRRLQLHEMKSLESESPNKYVC